MAKIKNKKIYFMSEINLQEKTDIIGSLQSSNILEIDSKTISSEILAVLIEEVKNEKLEQISAYNRFHNRHNRSR